MSKKCFQSTFQYTNLARFRALDLKKIFLKACRAQINIGQFKRLKNKNLANEAHDFNKQEWGL